MNATNQAEALEKTGKTFAALAKLAFGNDADVESFKKELATDLNTRFPGSGHILNALATAHEGLGNSEAAEKFLAWRFFGNREHQVFW